MAQIVVVGSAQTPANSTGALSPLSVAAVARLTSAGVLDTSFNPSGRVPGTLIYTYNLGEHQRRLRQRRGPRGHPDRDRRHVPADLPTEPSSTPAPPPDLTVTRLTTNGAFDTTFNGSGKFMLSLNQAGITFNTFGTSHLVTPRRVPIGELLASGRRPLNYGTAASGALAGSLTPTGAPTRATAPTAWRSVGSAALDEPAARPGRRQGVLPRGQRRRPHHGPGAGRRRPRPSSPRAPARRPRPRA